MDIDTSHKDFRQLVMSNFSYVSTILIFIVFSCINLYFFDNIKAGLVEIFLILPSLYGYLKLRVDHNIEKSAFYATSLLFISLLVVLFIFNFDQYIIVWALLFPFVAITLVGKEKGLIFIIIFNLIVYIGAYYFWYDSGMVMISYVRFVMVSLIISILVYFSEVSISSFFETQKKLNESLIERVKEAKILSITDSLTKLYNKRHFDTIICEEFNRAKRAKEPFVLAIVDIDNFKSYNDTYGHDMGNEALEKVGFILNQQTSRSGDYAFRIGGEEFAIILQSSFSEDIYAHLDNLREKIQLEKIDHINNKPFGTLTISIGAISVNNYEAIGITDVYKKADKNLYIMKNNGRNRVKLTTL